MAAGILKRCMVLVILCSECDDIRCFKMEMLRARGICDLIVDSYVKVREKHDGATGFH